MKAGPTFRTGILVLLALSFLISVLAVQYVSRFSYMLGNQAVLVSDHANRYDRLLAELGRDLQHLSEHIKTLVALLEQGQFVIPGAQQDTDAHDSMLDLAKKPESGLQMYADNHHTWLRSLKLTTPRNNQLKFTPFAALEETVASGFFSGPYVDSRKLVIERDPEQPASLRIQYPVRQGMEILATLEIEAPTAKLDTVPTGQQELLGKLLLVNEKNQILQWIEPAAEHTTYEHPASLAEALPAGLTSRISYPQDVIAGHYLKVNGVRLLRTELSSGGWHVFHILPNQAIRALVWPEMALSGLLGCVYILMLASLVGYRNRLRQMSDHIADYEFLFRNSKIPQLLVDTSNDSLVRSNRAASRLFGFPRKTLAEIPFSNLCQPSDSGEIASSFGGTLKQARVSGNQKILVDVIASVPEDKHPRIQHYFLLNASSMDKRSQSIRFQAYYDPLTRLPNRNFLFEHLQKLLATHRRENNRFALLFVDLDRFKQVNDTLGHDVGDQVLLTVGERLKSRLRESDILARLGGDEFTIVLPHLRDQMDASMVAKTLVNNLKEPFSVAGYDIHIGASVGISIYPDNGEDANTLLKNADIAMYQAKDMGRGGYCFFQDEMNSALLRKLELESDIVTALDKQQFLLELQPILEVSSLRIAGAEILLRWQHPVYGLLAPADFIHIAEETGQIVSISEWLLRETLGHAESWMDQDGGGWQPVCNDQYVATPVDKHHARQALAGDYKQ
jgi:diguanylate cyclase (GGDEF)-like protein